VSRILVGLLLACGVAAPLPLTAQAPRPAAAAPQPSFEIRGKVTDLGVAKLAPLAVMLGAVTVKEERAAVVTEPDRTAYRARDVAPGAANASDLLEHVPAVQVDVDGKVSLRGNENVVVQINGRPTPMRGTQLASYLKSLPANTIDRIEVIPNPSVSVPRPTTYSRSARTHLGPVSCSDPTPSCSCGVKLVQGR